MALVDDLLATCLFDQPNRWTLQAVVQRGENRMDDIIVFLRFNTTGELIGVSASSNISAYDIANAERAGMRHAEDLRDAIADVLEKHTS